MADKKEAKKYTKKQILASQKYKDFYVLNELLKEDGLYSIDEIEAMLKKFKKEVKR